MSLHPALTGTNHPLPFDRLSPLDFERLCLWLVEREGYERAEHLGAAGGEQGRDITAWRRGRLWAFQCKRVRSFGPRGALEEVEKVLALAIEQRPVGLVFLVSCAVSAKTRQQALDRCAEEGLACDFWAGAELDEKVKRHPDIVAEFFQVNQASAPEIMFTVPYPRNPDFVGREEELAELQRMIHQGVTPVGIRPTVLVGLGGIGKTQLAVEYAHAHRGDYPSGVFWLNAVNPLIHEFSRLSKAMGLAGRDASYEQAARRAWAYLDTHPDALVVFDNVIEPAGLNLPFAPGLIPAALRCPTLFTTRQRDFPRNLQPFEVKVLPETAAMRLLLRTRPEALDENHPEWSAARIICASLGWLPLALELAAAYLGAYHEVTLEGYLERLRAEGSLTTVDDTDLCPKDLPTRHGAAVAATLCTQWARLDGSEDADARLLFQAAGQFPESAWIPLARLGLLTGIEAMASPGRASPLARVLKRLHAISLIQELTHDHLGLHPLVQEFAAELSPAALRGEMAARLASVLKDVLQFEGQVVRRGVYPVLGDLRAGLWLCSGEEKCEPARARLAELEHMLDREAHTLRGWDSRQRPAFFAQQVHSRAAHLGLTRLAVDAATRCAQLATPLFDLRWRAGPESSALERTLAGHESTILAVRVTADGRRIVSAAKDGALKVWNLQTGQEERTLLGHEGSVLGLAVTPDGRRIVSASADHTLKVWDMRTGYEERTLRGHGGRVHAVALTPDGRRAISGSEDRSLRVWDLQTGEEEQTLAGHAERIECLAVTGHGRYVISGSNDRTLKVWDLWTGVEERTLEVQKHGLNTLAVTPDGTRLVSGANSRILNVWDLRNGQIERVLVGHEDEVCAVVVMPDSLHALSASSDHTLKVWDLQTGQETRTLTGHGDWVVSVALTSDGRRAVSASGKVLKVWNLQTEPDVRSLAGHRQGVNALGLVPNGQQVVSASDDHTLKVWDLQTGDEECTLTGHDARVLDLALSPDARRAISASEDHTLKVWNLQTGEEERTLAGHDDEVCAVVVTPDGRWVLSGSQDHALMVWNLQTGRRERTLVGHEGRVTSLVMAPEGQRVISGSALGELKVWNLGIWEEERALVGHVGWVESLAVTPNGQWLVSGSVDRTLKIWNLQTGVEECTLESNGAMVSAVAVSSGGQRIVSGSSDCILRVWNLQTRQEEAAIALESVPWCVAFAPDDAILAGDEIGNIYRFHYEE